MYVCRYRLASLREPVSTYIEHISLSLSLSPCFSHTVSGESDVKLGEGLLQLSCSGKGPKRGISPSMFLYMQLLFVEFLDFFKIFEMFKLQIKINKGFVDMEYILFIGWDMYLNWPS